MKRRTATVLLMITGAVTLVGAVFAATVRDTVVDSQEFADRAGVAYSTPEVREVITAQIVDQITAAEPELLQVQPLLETIVNSVLDSEIASDIFRASVADVHRAVFTDDVDTVVVQLADLILVAKTQLTVLDPETGALIPDELTDAIVSVETQQLLVSTVQLAEGLRFLAFLLPVVSIAAFVAAAWVSREPRRILVRVGFVIVGSAAFTVVVERTLRFRVIDGLDDEGDAAVAGAVWDAFAGDMGVWALALAAAGAAVSAVAWAGVGSGELATRVEQSGRWVRRRSTTWERIVWGLAVSGAGLILITQWQLSLRFIITVVGAAMVAMGAREIIITVAPGFSSNAALSGPARTRRAPASIRNSLTTVFLVGLGALVLAGIWRSGGTDKLTIDPGCNGSVVLCDRPLDQIAMAATHNSHAAAQDGFTFGYQTTNMISQLEDGVRGLLIDVYFGLEVDAGSVVTDRAPISDEQRAQFVAEAGESAVRAAEALVENTDAAGGRRDLFLCHAFCEIGAKPFEPELRAIRQFLDEHPRDVIQIIIQDEGPLPSDIAPVFEQSGLIDLVYSHTLGDSWPTLRQMIEAESRVFVSAENQSGEFDWYHDAFTFTQDTPFKFEMATEFSCEQNRGTSESPLLLVNHWLSPVSPTEADRVNKSEVLRARIEQCQLERNRAPNLIAVDFYDRGDLLEIIDALNGT